jgi:hypothetical protein
MSTTNFNRADLALTGSAALAYGVVPTGTIAVVFHGTVSNVDDTNKATHTLNLEIHNGSTVINRLHAISVPYGAAAKIPKMVVKPGESVYANADVASVLALSMEVLEVVG